MGERKEKLGLGSFVAAAEECGVSPVELKDWMFQNVAAAPTRWSEWMGGVKAIPKKHLLAFMRAKFVVPPEALPQSAPVVPIRNRRKGRG